ncbi:MAG: hypothetical protein ACPGMR_13410 [Pontibacterium sp.]
MDQKDQKPFLQITPAGAYYATVSSEPDDARAFLLQLLSSDVPLPYSKEVVEELTDLESSAATLLFKKMAAKRFVRLTRSPTQALDESVEQQLPKLLAKLTGNGKAALADDQGFCLGAVGFEEEHAEAVSALAADLVSLHERHLPLLNRQMGLSGESWGMIDPLGQSQIGFWVIKLGSLKFVLILESMPRLNHQSFVDLLSVLARRYLDY